ncbi:hypothetical protein [Prosthecobacter sp.]|uniref:hypothetical protein n=1 Tax=Prosthecobacter sp. TaxID=1965333 RepID=UPI002487BA29|nr:hypothetical protein [Prosthecobacter sp.]MDI1312510.1 hypothetical protein [Prosthecobacter sp.]
MSARTLLIEEIARAPESVAQEILTQLRSLMPRKNEVQPVKDHFESYWKHLYGSLEGAEWNEPVELPYETRETW